MPDWNSNSILRYLIPIDTSELRNLWTVVLVVIRALGGVSTNLKKIVNKLEVRGKVGSVQKIALMETDVNRDERAELLRRLAAT